jgi:hypothetical protein
VGVLPSGAPPSRGARLARALSACKADTRLAKFAALALVGVVGWLALVGYDPRAAEAAANAAQPQPPPPPPADPRALFRHGDRAEALLATAAVGAKAAPGAPARVVVTLGSFGCRAGRLGATIHSLLNQSTRPDRIYVSLPLALTRRVGGDGEACDPVTPAGEGPLPGELAALEDAVGRDVLVVLHPPDWGPATKLLPVLAIETHPQTVLVVVDDDVVYDPRTVGALVDAVVASAAGPAPARAPFAAPGRPACFCCEEPKSFGLGLHRWTHTRTAPGLCEGYPCAYAGEAFLRAHFPDLGLFDYSTAPAGCRLHDDVWIGGYLWARGRQPVLLAPPGWASVLSHRPWDATAVHSVPSTVTDYQIPCLRHFDYFGG